MKTYRILLLFLFTFFALLVQFSFAQINLGSGLLAHYPLDGNSKSTAGVSGYDLTNYSATTTTGHFGDSAGAYYFNGSTYMLGSFSATGYSGLTISAWINTTYTSNMAVVMSTPWSVAYVNRFTAGRFMAAFDGSTGNNASTDQTSANVENGWTLVTATSDGSTTRLYVNGVFDHSYSETMVSTTGNGGVCIGNSASGGPYLFQGSIDDVRIYTRTLSANEIKALYQLPRAIFASASACLGMPVSFTDKSDTIVGHNHYLWRFGDNTTDTSRNPKHTYAKAGTYQVWMRITSPAGGADSTLSTVTVYPKPGAAFTDSSINGRLVIVAATDTSISSYNWDFGDNTYSTNTYALHTYSRMGSYTVTLMTRNMYGCRDTVKKSVTAFEIPKAAFSANNVCAGAYAVFTNMSADTEMATCHWDFGDHTTSNTFENKHKYTTAGTYKTTLIVSNTLGYADSATAYVNVYPQPDAGFSSTASKTSVHFTPDDGSLSSYFWDFGDSSNSVAKQPSHIYSHYGTFMVTLTVKNLNGCDSTIAQPLKIEETITAGFSAANTCLGNAVNFMDSSQSDLPITFMWDFGDKTSSSVQNPSHNYTAAGVYNVKLKVRSTSGLTDSITRQVRVYPVPSARFSVKTNNFKANFIPQDTTLFSYNWDFGDSNGSSFKEPDHIYGFDNVFKVTLKTTNSFGCDSVYSLGIVVKDRSGIYHPSVAQAGLSIYPNPATGGQVMLVFHNQYGNGRLRVLDMNGKLIRSEMLSNLQVNNQTLLDVSDWEPGIYIIKTESDAGIATLRLMKE